MLNETQMLLAQNEWTVAPRQLEEGRTNYWHAEFTEWFGFRVTLAEGEAWQVLVQTDDGEELVGEGKGATALLSLLHSELQDF
jgi:hypothetical protein